MAHHHGSDTPTSPRAVLHHTDANLCTILHTTVVHFLVLKNIGKRNSKVFYVEIMIVLLRLVLTYGKREL